MAGIDITSLFADVLPNPQRQLEERTLQQSDAVNQANAVGQLGGMAAYLAPQRGRAMAAAGKGLLGIPQTTTPADAVKAQLAAASSQQQTPESLIRLANLVQNTDPEKAAGFRSAAAQLNVQETEQERQQEYRKVVARRAATSPRFKADVVSIIDGTLPTTEVDRIYEELTEAEEVKSLEAFQLILPDGTQQTALYDGKGGYYDVTSPTTQLTLEEGTQVIRSSQVGGVRDFNDPRENQLQESQINTAQFTTGVNNVIATLEKYPDANTAAAAVAGTINSLIQEAEAVMNLKNDGDRVALFEKLALGVENASMQSMLIGLAYQAAKAEGQKGRDVSNADIERFMKQLGANSSDPQVLIQNITRLKQEAQQRFSTQYSFVRGTPWEGSFEPADVSIPVVAVPAGTPNSNL